MSLNSLEKALCSVNVNRSQVILLSVHPTNEMAVRWINKIESNQTKATREGRN